MNYPILDPLAEPDIVKRLQHYFDLYPRQPICKQAAVEIERLRTLIESECRRAEDAHGEAQRASLEIERLRETLASIERAKFCNEEEIAEHAAEIERLRAERAEILKVLHAIANTVSHQRDGQDVTIETIHKFARAAIAKAEGR